MKLRMLLLAVLFSQSTLVFAAVEYRRAVLDDADNITALIADFSEDDERKIAVPPYLGLDLWIQNEINSNHFFVACDSDEDNPIIGFCKIYILPAEELVHVIGDELGAVEPNNFEFNMEKPDCNLLYKITREQANNFGHSFVPTKTKNPTPQLSIQDTYIYLGTNYTKPSRRGEYVNTELEAFAFREIREAVRTRIAAGGSLYYTFGVVEENWNTRLHVRAFTKFCQSFMPQARKSTHCYITFTAFASVKPTYVIAGDTDDENGNAEILMSPRLPQPQPNAIRGFGCFIGFKIPDRYRHQLGT